MDRETASSPSIGTHNTRAEDTTMNKAMFHLILNNQSSDHSMNMHFKIILFQVSATVYVINVEKLRPTTHSLKFRVRTTMIISDKIEQHKIFG